MVEDVGGLMVVVVAVAAAAGGLVVALVVVGGELVVVLVVGVGGPRGALLVGVLQTTAGFNGCTFAWNAAAESTLPGG